MFPYQSIYHDLSWFIMMYPCLVADTPEDDRQIPWCFPLQFTKALQPDLQTFNSVLVTFSTENQWRHTVTVLEQLQELMQPDVLSFHSLAAAMDGHWDGRTKGSRFQQVLGQMEMAGLQDMAPWLNWFSTMWSSKLRKSLGILNQNPVFPNDMLALRLVCMYDTDGSMACHL